MQSFLSRSARLLMAVAAASLSTVSAHAAEGPPPGRYQCVTTSSQTTIGWLWILPNQEYKIQEKGTVGRFTHDASTHELSWKSGKYVDYGWRGWYLPPNLKDEVRSERSVNRDAVLLLDKDKAQGVTPFQNARKADRSWIRCYWQKG